MKTEERKRLVQYVTGPDQMPTCANCQHFTSELRLPAWMRQYPEKYTLEKDGVESGLKCTMHGFAVKRVATCAMFERKAPHAGA